MLRSGPRSGTLKNDLPIGIFDSGVGGLTVLDAIARRLPAENLLYLGDTARVPYGTRSPQTVVRYAQRVAGHLYHEGIKALVVACNTATTWALPVLRQAGEHLGVPVLGVVEPGVRHALACTRSGYIGVIGTEGTIQGGEYTRQLLDLRPDLRLLARPAPLLVALAEEGWTHGQVARLTVERYLADFRDGPDTLILGCTHYPTLISVIAQVLPQTTLVNSADATALATQQLLAQHGLLRRPERVGAVRYLVTDNPTRFVRVGTHFLNRVPAPVEVVDIIDLDGHAFAVETP